MKKLTDKQVQVVKDHGDWKIVTSFEYDKENGDKIEVVWADDDCSYETYTPEWEEYKVLWPLFTNKDGTIKADYQRYNIDTLLFEHYLAVEYEKSNSEDYKKALEFALDIYKHKLPKGD